MGFFGSSSKDNKPQTCTACGGAGVVDTGKRSKWTGAIFGKCWACGGSGVIR